MEYPSRLCSGVNPDTKPHSSRPFSDADAVPLAAASDLNVAGVTRANLLVVGPEPLVRNVLKLVAPGAKSEDIIQAGEGRLQLPSVSRPSTLVVQDVDLLTAAEQRRLLEWLENSNPRTQVISTASMPLLPGLEARTFSETLYYRLNTIYIDLFE